MGKRSTVQGYWRGRGADSASSSKRPPDGPSVAVLPMVMAVVVNPAATVGTATGYTLPKGAIPLRVEIKSGHTGGTTPLVDIGLDSDTPDVDALVDGSAADADVAVGLGTTEAGDELGEPLPRDTEIVAGTGGGTAGTGTSTAFVYYTMDDDGALND